MLPFRNCSNANVWHVVAGENLKKSGRSRRSFSSASCPYPYVCMHSKRTAGQTRNTLHTGFTIIIIRFMHLTQVSKVWPVWRLLLRSQMGLDERSAAATDVRFAPAAADVHCNCGAFFAAFSKLTGFCTATRALFSFASIQFSLIRMNTWHSCNSCKLRIVICNLYNTICIMGCLSVGA